MKIRAMAAVVGAAFLFALGPGGPAYAASVTIGDNFFRPSTVTIGVGDTVTWTYPSSGDSVHTVTADDGPFDSGTLDPGSTYSHTFDAAGTFGYFCQIHGQAMSGTVVVQGAGQTSPPGGQTTLPATGPGIAAGPFLWLGVGLLVVGGTVLFALRRRRT